MDGSVFINPEQLNSIAKRFGDVGSDLAGALKHDAARLDEAGQPWGDDEEGEQFAREYLPAAQAAMHALVVVAQSLPRIGNGLGQMAQSSSANESSLVEQLGAPSLPSGATGSASAGGRLSAAPDRSVAVPGPSLIARALNPDLYSETPQPGGNPSLTTMTEVHRGGQR